MDIEINRIDVCEAGKLLGLVNMTLKFSEADAIGISDIRILKSESGPVATLAPEFASFPRTFSLSETLYKKILGAALNAYTLEMAHIAAAPPKPVTAPRGSSPVLADVKAEREAYLAKYPARTRNPKTWAAFRRQWKEGKNV